MPAPLLQHVGHGPALEAQGVKIVGTVPQGLPPFTLPLWDLGLWQQLLVPALLISVVGFVESVSVGQTLAAKRRQRIEPDQELVALGSSNLSAAFTGGFPATGGFARSVVNFDAGAQTPAAGVYTAVGITLASLFLTPARYYLPQATLAATIVVAVLSLVDFSILRKTWNYAKSDFVAVLAGVPHPLPGHPRTVAGSGLKLTGEFVACPEGLEPPTCCLEGEKCNIVKALKCLKFSDFVPIYRVIGDNLGTVRNMKFISTNMGRAQSWLL